MLPLLVPLALGSGCYVGSDGGFGAETDPAWTSASDSEAGDDGSGQPDDEDSGSTPECVDSDNHPPLPPAMTRPLVSDNDIVIVDDATFALEASPFEDLDASAEHGASEFEIWEMANGTNIVRVWSAALESGDLTRAALSDGIFADPATGALEPWTRYGIRTRYRDDDVCALWSEWGSWLELRSDDGSETLFDSGTIHDMYLTIPPESWDPINDEARPPGCVPFERSYHRGAFRFDNTGFSVNVGIRSKGGCGSARNLDEKAAFKINLEWDDPDVPDCAPEQRLFGQKKITLNNMVQDRSYMRERLSYAFYREMGIAVPRVSYVRVHVNDEYWGLYLHVESITRRFLSRWHADNDGILYEGTYGCDIELDRVPPTGAQNECFDQKFTADVCDDPDFEPVLDHSDLLDLASAVDAMDDGEFYPAIEQYVDFDQFLRLWAADGVVNNWDGFVASANNYRLYFEPTNGLWRVIPTGLDQTLEEQNAATPFGYWTTMVQRCVQEPACAAAFAEQLQIALALFQSTPFAAQIDEASALIAELAQNDPRRNHDPGQVEAEIADLEDWINNRPQDVEQYLANAGL
ncbi:MAG: CotH kinase family protein [Nannocystaceae bacterium]|nr:CotH kinase family protein [Nannocystaceae bacterium]